MLEQPFEEVLVPELFGRVLTCLGPETLFAASGVSRGWDTQIGQAEAAWESCFRWTFGSPASQITGSWKGAFRSSSVEAREVAKAWEECELQPKEVFAFASFVRSWTSDELLLVAGLYDGRLQSLDWTNGQVNRPFPTSHGDEVVSVALNQSYILSGSGDPGYYQRRGSDSTVRLWRRDGHPVAALQGHSDSVRGVCLFDDTGPLSTLGLSAGMDGQAILWSLPQARMLQTLELSGPCRSMMVVQNASLKEASEARVIAAAGFHIVELSVEVGTHSPTLSLLRTVEVSTAREREPGKGMFLSGFDCFVAPKTWFELPPGVAYPSSLLTDPGTVVAGGTVNGTAWTLRNGELVFNNLIENSRNQRDGSAEAVTVELLDKNHFLVACRNGTLHLVKLSNEVGTGSKGKAIVCWTRSGLRMYVSTLFRREPRLLVSDGFDNAIRTFAV